MGRSVHEDMPDEASNLLKAPFVNRQTLPGWLGAVPIPRNHVWNAMLPSLLQTRTQGERCASRRLARDGERRKQEDKVKLGEAGEAGVGGAGHAVE